jgi:penicillin-binding protein 1C
LEIAIAKAMRRKTLPKILIAVFLTLLILSGVWVFIRVFSDLPNLESLPAHLHASSVRITDRTGRLLYEIIPQEGGRHAVIPLEKIPVQLQQATIATEDANFYRNPGVDWKGIVRAFWINLQGGETLAGGSTLTQQVARNLLLSQQERYQQTLIRKAREVILAWQLTQRFSKSEILQLYLNQTYYGGLAYGVEAASQTFFGKPAADLDLAESALIAGLPHAPAVYNPYTDLERAQERQKIVLQRMESEGFITAEQRQLAENEPLVLAASPYPLEAPHFVMMVRNQLDLLFTPEELSSFGSLTVRTSLDLDWQHVAERLVQKQIDELKITPDGLGHNLNSAALIAMDPETGEILSLVGSPDYQDATNAGAINMALAPRQPGSALKPILYALALDPDLPQPWTAATMILDVQTSFVTHDKQAYTPTNYDLKEHGPVLVRQALASSLNIPAVQTLEHVGMKNLLDFAARLGISTFGDPDNYDLSLALGGGDVRLIDLTTAYAAFTNGGYRLHPVAILDITDSASAVVYRAPTLAKEQVIDGRLAWLITDILSDDQARLTGFGLNSILNLDRPAAVKTGTTSNFHDNWTIGYTPDLIVGVWAGNTNHEPMRDVSGVTGAAPIWHEFMRSVLSSQPEQAFTRPDGLVQVEICALSGLLPTPECPYRRMEWFIEGTQPVMYDPFFKRVVIDTATGKLASELTPLERQRPQVVLDLPAQAYPWARSQGLRLLYDYQVEDSTSLQSRPASLLRIVSPASESIFQISVDTSLETQQIPIEVTGEQSFSQVRLYLDGQLLKTFREQPYKTWWQLIPGNHQVLAQGTLSNGEEVSSQMVIFEVLESK